MTSRIEFSLHGLAGKSEHAGSDWSCTRLKALVNRYRLVMRLIPGQFILLLLFCLSSRGLVRAEDRGDSITEIGAAADILRLSNADADRHYPVQIRGVVTAATEYGLFVQDDSAGIWVSWTNPKRSYLPGQYVEVKGKTGAGLFSPDLLADQILPLGRRRLPAAKRTNLKALLAGDENDQFVQVQGVVRSVDIRSNVSAAQRVWLGLLVDGVRLFATLPAEDAQEAEKLLGARIRLSAVAACSKNADRQITATVLLAMGKNNVRVLAQAPPNLFDAPLLRVQELLQYHSPASEDGRVRIRGVVTLVKAGDSLIVQDRSRAVLVQTTYRNPVRPGDEVEVTGYPVSAPSGPYVADGIYRFLRVGSIPEPQKVSLEELSSGRLNYNLVSVTGKLLQHTNGSLREELLLEDRGRSVIAEMISSGDTPHSLEWLRDGSTVQVTGINVLTVEGSWNQGGPTSSSLRNNVRFRSPADVKEIHPPPWMSTTHLLYVAFGLAILVVFFLIVIFYGRLQRWRLETIAQERQRVAHEVHDTLAQSFAGIGFQLQAVRRAIPSNELDLRRQVDHARALVSHSHKEAIRSIDPRDLKALETVDVLSVLQDSARKLVEGGGVVVEVRRSGAVRNLPALVKDVLVHAGQEAVANSVRHADPRRITLTLTFADRSVTLTVEDDGTGFVERGDLLGFGLRGMRRRAASVGGKLTIDSVVGKGTRVSVVCPLPRSAFARMYYSGSRGS